MLLLLQYLDEKKKFTVLKSNVLAIKGSDDTICMSVGRKTDCDVPFPSDKSISRKHCNLTLYPDGRLMVTDLKSSFGTHIDGIKCPPNEEVVLNDKAILKLGNEFTNIRLSKFKFCNSRLNKKEKEILKGQCSQFGGEVVKQLETSSHLVCTSYSATVSFFFYFVSQI